MLEIIGAQNISDLDSFTEAVTEGINGVAAKLMSEASNVSSFQMWQPGAILLT